MKRYGSRRIERFFGMRLLCLCLLIIMTVITGVNYCFGRDNYPIGPEYFKGFFNADNDTVIIDPYARRRLVVHDAGDLYSVFVDGMLSTGQIVVGNDPETGRPIEPTTYPNGSSRQYVWVSGMWVGGIVGSDTLVSTGFDPQFGPSEIFSDNNQGASFRMMKYADDEFVTTVADTFPSASHDPLGIQITATSHAWADSLYDDFILIDFVINNIGNDTINKGWVGQYWDDDIYHRSFAVGGWTDDCSGCLDTLLYDDDLASRVCIPYSFDNDGDSRGSESWLDESVPAVVSVRLLESSFDITHQNFNWWQYNPGSTFDFGPRRVGTAEDPFRPFTNDNLGTPLTDEDKYYMMSHPEIDYMSMETAIKDSAQGWIPTENSSMALDLAGGYDTRFLFSFGPFDLAPGDSITFTMALVMGKQFHSAPDNYNDYFDPYLPHLFYETLDFSELLIAHRRADSVYRSGYMLPRPGPPQGLKIVSYDDAYVDLIWNASQRPDLAGYYISYMDTLIDENWHHAIPAMVSDTFCTIEILDPDRAYFFAVSLIDSQGRESGQSFSRSVLTGVPHPPINLELQLDGMQPVLTWQPSIDTAFQVFMIHRSIWNQPYVLYDSTSALSYRDLGTESGVRYNYMISAKNDLDIESGMAGPVSALPMALDQGVLFYEFNSLSGSNSGPFQPEFLDSLFYSATTQIEITRRNYSIDPIGFKEMADYSHIIFDWEQREGGWWPENITDSIKYYLAGGGSALFIILATGDAGLGDNTVTFAEGNFFHDYLKLDSAVTHGHHFSNGKFYGDLTGCQPLDPHYPKLAADTTKLNQSFIPVEGYIPMAGHFYPTPEAEPIYAYLSSAPDTAHHGEINGIRFQGDKYNIVLMNFPLSLMEEQDNFHALRRALIDIGLNMSCGDVRDDGSVHIGDAVALINYIFRDGPEPVNMAGADVDCSGEVNLGDIVILINYFFGYSDWLNCCP